MKQHCLLITSARRRRLHQPFSKLNPHKNDGGTGLSSDHFIFAGPDFPVHIAFLFTCITVHGFMPEDFLPSSVIRVPKKRGCNANSLLVKTFVVLH